VVLYNVRH